MINNMNKSTITKGLSVHKFLGDLTATVAGSFSLLGLPSILSILVCLCALTWWGFRFYEKFTGKTIGKKPAN